MAKWVMRERKQITVNGKTTFYDIGEPAPAGHEGKPYTVDAEKQKAPAGK